jgi:lysophospholipase L1-like esterase
MGARHWVGTWACGPQLTEPDNLPPAPGLSGNTLRQVVQGSIGGDRLRVRLSNAYGEAPLTLRSAHLARSASGNAGAIDTATDQVLTFGGAASRVLAPGETAFSDPLDFAVSPLTQLSITIQFGAVPRAVTGHPGSRTTSYLQPGNAVDAAALPNAVTTDHWYCVTGIDVLAGSASAALITLGDSLTDGRGSTTNGNDRWPDNLARRLHANAATRGIAVLNQGIGGNAVLSGGLGPTALERFERDVLEQSGGRWLIVLAGVNDIGMSRDPAIPSQLSAAFHSMIRAAHERGLLAYGVPILPFGGSAYFSPDQERARLAVNDWIRTSHHFDAVIDLDAALRDPAQPARLLGLYDCGDHLHLSVAGYQRLADSIDLRLFTR